MRECSLIVLLASGMFLVTSSEAVYPDVTGSTSGFALANGDSNGDMERDLSDAVYLLSHLFLGGPAPVPLANCAAAEPQVTNGDSNGDGALDVSDPVHLLDWLFSAGPQPASACLLPEGLGADANPNPRVVPATASAYGRTYGEWGAAWWQWAFGAPAAVNPLIDDNGQFCAVGQEGPVWFLAGSVGGLVERDCTVPAGKALFFPVVNMVCAPAFGDGETEEEIRACANSFIGAVTGLEVTVDGVALENLVGYQADSPAFDIPLPEGDLLGMGPGVMELCVTDGIWILLTPLTAGDHTVHLRGEIGGGFPDGFETEALYSITVSSP